MEINIDLLRKDTDLLIARARAIEEYGNLEQSLCRLFAHLLGVEPDVAAIVFFRISGSWQRNQVIELLLEKKFGSLFDPYWHGLPGQPGKPKSTGLMVLLRKIDEARNQIVHWTTIQLFKIDAAIGSAQSQEVLIPPNVWAFRSEKQMLTVADLNDFSEMTDFVSRSINMFTHHSRDAADLEQPWRDILQQPCTYPPSAGHPLIRTTKELRNPPQPSEA